LANIAFLGAVISLPVPTASFFLPGTTIYHPSPPSIHTVIENILPTNNFKTHLTKGLQSPSPLVRHSTALTLVKCLQKYDSVVTTFQEVADTLEEEEDGQWRQAIVALEAEARKRVPELQVIIAFSQQKSDVVQEKSASGDGTMVATLKASNGFCDFRICVEDFVVVSQVLTNSGGRGEVRLWETVMELLTSLEYGRCRDSLWTGGIC
jgi:nucleolar pre-ribosomal-associated protein 1